jgi:enoyl-CoA hydratase/carnithine racemase
MGETTEDSVIARRDGRVGRIVLNRSRALNALDLGMIRRIAIALDGWRDVPEVHAVVIESASDRAFCAGGDIRAVRQMSLSDDHQGIETFFTEEYAVNRAIAEYPKPIVALVDGICMGGGIGLSVHGQARVATERAVFAMPETAIALFPDIGATYLLPRLPGALGVYLALTGARMEAADAVHAGLATHFVPRERLPALSAALAAEGVAVLAGFAAPLPPFRLRAERAAIDRCFAAPSLSGIVAALVAEGSEWAAATLATLRLMSPSSLAWSLEIVRAGAHRTLPQCLAAELALTRHATRHPDFLEGVRAMVVDKDRTPRWSPETIEQLTGG